MKIIVVGTGYVGLVSGACFADFGHTVVCVDVDGPKIELLKAGQMPLFEPGLEEIVAKNVKLGRLAFATDLKQHIDGADVAFLAVGTPPRRIDGQADLSFVYQAAREIAACASNFLVIATKSTVPVGTGDEIERVVRKARPELSFGVASNPEFLRQGSAVKDFQKPDRIVIGSNDERTRAVMAEIYRPLEAANPHLMFTDRRTSELIKYAANAFLATKITYINEMADLCEQVGANVQDVARGIGLDNRIGPKFLDAGPGIGGSCFPKDTQALIKSAQDHGAPMRIVETVAAFNENRKRAMARRIVTACGGSVRDKSIAVLGLAFKPNTDDMRDAPSLSIVTALEDVGACVRGYDPEAMEQARRLMPNVELFDTAYDCIRGADAMVIVTEWAEFRTLDMARVKSLLKAPVVVDLRNIYKPDEMLRGGFNYHSIGRPTVLWR
ncbi:MAG: UDP-glucose/GDP-mannose dehydrogenase family protein [Hyphomicrobiaceae bacterium]|nr:UDP-glucose/GDP-mannose dehydrogenase family protein [Hyphomicrobiaceae bacterium]